MAPSVLLTVARDNGNVLRHAARLRYIDALEGAGADVTVVGPADPLPERFDALCLAGGEDVEPHRYGEEPRGVEDTDAGRDELELTAVQRALAQEVPVLGICRGFQVLNVALGGSLIQHLEGHRPQHEEVVRHRVTAAPGSILERIYGREPFAVNSRHHQAVTGAILAPGLRATAHVDDLVEAFESVDHRYVLGVQWHPERVHDRIDRPERVFEDFVRAAASIPAR